MLLNPGLTGDPNGGAPPVLILGEGITALGVVRILARDNIPAYVVESSDPLLRRSRWFRRLPAEFEKNPNEALADWLVRLPLTRAVLMPCSDNWVTQVAALAPALRERFPASVPTRDTLLAFVDKGGFADLLSRSDTPHPFSKAVESRADLETVPDAVFTSAMLKPRNSQDFIERFGVKALHVHSRESAGEQLESIVDEGFHVILQEYIPGPAQHHYLVDGFIDRFGEVRATLVRQRLRMYPFDFGNSTFMVTVDAGVGAAAVSSITRLLKDAGHRGMFSAEFKLDSRDSVFKLLEVNVRAWWYVEFAARCGVDVCRMAYEDALGRPVANVGSYAVGRRLVFPYNDYPACKALWREGKLSAAEWARSWLGSIQPVFQFADPVPGVRSFVELLGVFFKVRVRRLPVVAFLLSLLS
ncbi:MAG: hypothetical protein ABJF01_09455 [bacterium]